ncbi:putative monooxygenase CAT5 PWA37_005190 [Arxiozyma heterogenica]|uniref:5-demethoxyubiquinone hydroxylase, mitochondrial n=1 Tax=Arxiozyma heterogenica TaxID=278026 RepID=A0AAN7WJM8_9SACH|nr:hypothetical protein RI543_000127 [Kazachstania heterogenica]
MLKTNPLYIQTNNTRFFSVLSKLKTTKSTIELNTNITNSNVNASTSTSTTAKVIKPLSAAQRAYLDRVIRVDQAGELGADYIYRGQIFVLSRKYPHLRSTLDHMWEQEVYHRDTFNQLQLKHRVRPSLITPIWKVGAIVMGAGTALISKEAAMACTEAVETVIGGHYNEQLRVLNNKYEQPVIESSNNSNNSGGGGETVKVPDEVQHLISKIKEFRDQELEHLDTAIEHDSRMAVPYTIITETIKNVCRVAIWCAERI